MTITRAQFFQTVVGTIAAFFGVKKAAAMSTGEVTGPGIWITPISKIMDDVLNPNMGKYLFRVPFVTQIGGSYAKFDPGGGRVTMITTRSNSGKAWIQHRYLNGQDPTGTIYDKNAYRGREIDKILIDEAPEIPILRAGDKFSVDFEGSMDPFKSGLIFNISNPDT